MTDSRPQTAPPPVPEPTDATSRGHAEALRAVAVLGAELALTTEPSRRAMLQHAMGALLERDPSTEAQAVREYLGAYNHDPRFRPPLLALMRIFERRRSFKNLGRLFEAEGRSAHGDDDRAASQIDRAMLLEDHLEAPGEALALFQRAADARPTSALVALMLERAARRAGDEALAMRAVDAQGRVARDPTLKALLLTESALWREKGGDVDEALAMLEEAARLPASRWRTLEALERVARRNDRHDALARSLEERARLVMTEAGGEATPLGSGAFAVARFGGQEQAAALASSLWLEAARVHAGPRRDLGAAANALREAIALRPDDPLLQQEHLLVAELAGDTEAAADAARRLLAAVPTGGSVTALHFRLSRIAEASGDTNGRTAHLAAAVASDPTHATARGLLDDRLVEEGRAAERVRSLREAAARLSGEARAARLFEAADVLRAAVGDFAGAESAYLEAADASESPAPILRELYDAAMEADAVDVALEAGSRLLALELDDAERSALLRDRVMLVEASGDGAGRLEKTLTHATSVEAAASWAPEAARLHAALAGNGALLAAAHRALAERAWDDATATAHLAAAARASAQGGDEDAAIADLRRALERSPGQRYAVALLEELLLARGEADEAVALLRASADAERGASHAERALLLAGAAAEAAGDGALAAETYRDAAAQAPRATSPLWALYRVGIATGRPDWVLEALSALAERESAAEAVGRGTLLLAEHHALVSRDAALAQPPLEALMRGGDAAEADYAAVLLLGLDPASVDPDLRLLAVERLREAAGEADASAAWRLAGGVAAGVDAGHPLARRAAAELAALDASDPFGHVFHLLRFGGSDSVEPKAAALTTLGERTEDDPTGAALLLHALRVRLFGDEGGGGDDAFLLAQEIAERAPGTAAAAVAVDETLEASDDPEARAEALAARIVHASPETRSSLRSAQGRALAAAGRSADALGTLRAVVAGDAEDLAAWEALRGAARETGAWAELVDACDRLAAVADGAHRARLLEEAGAAAMDHLRDDAGAERRFRAALAEDARSPIAYGRLHDLLAEQARTTDLLALLQEKIDHEDDGDLLASLFYEQARLLRSTGDRSGALGALENLLMLDEQHAGGIALAVEIHVSLEDWSEAVASLRRLAACDVPPAQKRIARLGAADFLEKKLGDPRAALDELRAVKELGLADGTIYARMADIAERAELPEEAVQWLDEAVAHSAGAERAALAKRAGALREGLGYNAGAVRSYQTALEVLPTDLEAAEAVAHLLTSASERVEHSRRFEAAVRASLDRRRVDVEAVRLLREAANFRGDHGLGHVALDALVALGVATEDELDAIDQDTKIVRMAVPATELAARTVDRIRAPGDEGPLAELLRLAGEALTEVDGLDPAGFGVGKKELVGAKPPHPARAQLEYVGGLFGLPTGDVYVGGDDPNRVIGFASKKERLTWVLGSSAAVRVEPVLRFHAGRQAAAAAAGTTSLVSRTPAEAATLVFALFEAGEAPLEAGVGRTGLNEWSRALAKALPRRVRKAIPELAAQVPDGGRGVEAYCAAVRQTALRAGTLVSGSLLTAFAEATGHRPSPESIEASPAALDLYHFWISDGALALRRELGLLT